MKRYDIPFNCDCRTLKETADGDYVLHSDHEAALAAALAKERDRALAELAKVKAENVWFAEQLKTAEAERDAEMAKEREVVIDIINAYSTVCDRSADMLQAIRARSKP